ncbi:MAG TPA: hypothetical protein VGG68_00795 [Caulobacteraceae bacterium]
MSRAKVEAWCAEQGIALTIERPVPSLGAPWHVHADIEAPRSVFRAHGLHNLAVWIDDAAPNWKAIQAELRRADIGPCTDPDCDHCNQENDQ